MDKDPADNVAEVERKPAPDGDGSPGVGALQRAWLDALRDDASVPVR